MRQTFEYRAAACLGLILAVWSLGGASEAVAAGKTKPRQPDLKIVSVDVAPAPFVISEAPLTLTITVELPKSVPDDAVLNVTTLITSPSKSSMRLLENSQPLTEEVLAAAKTNDGLRRLDIVQQWDGRDHVRQLVGDGIYDYLIQAKVLVAGKNGRVTRESSWKKRGTVEVRTR